MLILGMLAKDEEVSNMLLFTRAGRGGIWDGHVVIHIFAPSTLRALVDALFDEKNLAVISSNTVFEREWGAHFSREIIRRDT